MSTEVIAVIIMIAVQVLSWAGVQVGTEQVTNFVVTGITIVTGIVAWYRSLQLKKEIVGASRVNMFGGVRN